MGILSESDIESDVFESICDFMPHDEYEKLNHIIRNHLNRVEGHDGEFDIWFRAHRVSPDGYEWRMSHGVGMDIRLTTITEVAWQTGGVWSVHDTDAVVSYIMRVLKSNYEFYTDYKEQMIPSNGACQNKIIFRVDGIKKKQKDSAETTTWRNNSLFVPKSHFAADWWAPRES